MNSTMITIPNEDLVSVSPTKTNKETHFSISSLLPSGGKYNTRQLIHSFKVGIALVLVSLLYLIDSLYKQVGENAMWAIMTVVVIFEFSAGAMLSKGLNRGVGTILGGLLGCLAAFLADKIGGISEPVVVGISIFLFGAAASYTRLIPSFKKKYDYGAMIFILTFNLVIVSGLRDKEIFDVARDRLLTIGIGFVICIFVSLIVFPIWSSDELHSSTASKFHSIATSIEGCFEEYFKSMDNKDDQKRNLDGYIAVLNSKSKDEILANFAKWEPWHGKFGFSHPWDKYLNIAEKLRELAATTLSLKGCLESPRQPSAKSLKVVIKEPCEAVASLLAKTLRELGESIEKTKLSKSGAVVFGKTLSKTRQELRTSISASELGELENIDGIAVASIVFMLMEMIDRVDVLVKDVEELGTLAGFLSH